MYKINSDGHVDNSFVDEDVNNGIPGTIVTAEWLNTLQDEIINVLEAANIKPSQNSKDQLIKAIRTLIVSTGVDVSNFITNEELTKAIESLDMSEFITNEEMSEAIKKSVDDYNHNIFSIFHKKSTQNSVSFRILNGIALDDQDELTVKVFDSNLSIVASTTITGASASGDNIIKVTGLENSTTYTAQAFIRKTIESSNQYISSGIVSFATIAKYGRGDVLFDSYERGIVTTAELAQIISPDKKLKIYATAGGGNGYRNADYYGYDGEKIDGVLFDIPTQNINIIIGYGSSVGKGGDTIIGSLITLTGGAGHSYKSNRQPSVMATKGHKEAKGVGLAVTLSNGYVSSAGRGGSDSSSDSLYFPGASGFVRIEVY